MTTLTSPLLPGTAPRPILNAFIQPTGLAGRLGGRMMARSHAQQQEIAELLDDPGPHLCEVGSGPGLMATLLSARHPQLRLTLVDPSPVMRSQAARRCANLPLVTVNDGVAERLGLPDGNCDSVLAVNTVAMWPNPDAALAEIRRVLRPGGQVVLSWHSPTSPSPSMRRLALSAVAVEDLKAALSSTFDQVRQHDLVHSTAWTACRPAAVRRLT